MKSITAFLCALAVWFAPLAIANQFASLLVGSVASASAPVEVYSTASFTGANTLSVGPSYISVRWALFVAPESCTVSQVQVRGLRVGTTSAKVRARLFASSANLPTGSALGSSSWVDVSGIGTSEETVTFTGMSVAITSGTTYSIIVESDLYNDADNYFGWRVYTAGAAEHHGRNYYDYSSWMDDNDVYCHPFKIFK